MLVDTPGHSTERSVIQAATILGRAGCSGVVYRLPEATGVDVYRADLAEVVNTYVDEARKNVIRDLDAVEGSDVVLLFDEADLVVDRRTDVKDG